MKQCLFVLFILFSGHVCAQPPDRFTGLYYPNPNLNSESYGVVETSYGYMVSGIIYDTINSQGFWAFGLKGIDVNGNELWQKKYGGSGLSYYNGWYNSENLKKINGGIYSIVNINTGNPDSIISAVIKFTETGDTLWQKVYTGDSTDTIVVLRHIDKTIDNGFILTGSTYNNSIANDKVILIKTDSSGNIIWRKKHDYLSNYERANAVVQDPVSKKYLIVGIRGNPSKGFLYITDSLGNIVSQSNIGSAVSSNFYNIKNTSDGNFYIAGNYDTGNIVGGWDMNKPYLLKVDTSGTIIWSKQYGNEQIVSDFSNMIVLTGDTIIAAGQVDTFFTQSLGLNSMYQIYKIAPNGDSLWSRYIDIISSNGTQDVFKSIITTGDGGYALTGFFSSVPLPNPFVLVKLDQWGCDTVGCQFMSVAENESEDLSLDLFPNPSNGKITLKVNSPDYSDFKYEIYDLAGKLLITESFSYTEIEIDLSLLKDAVYFVSVLNKNNVLATKKVILQRDK